MGAPKKPRKKKARAPDIRETFDKLADNAMIDDRQLGELTVKGTSTIKRYRRQGKLPPVVMIGGHPRHLVGRIRQWLHNETPASVKAGARLT